MPAADSRLDAALAAHRGLENDVLIGSEERPDRVAAIGAETMQLSRTEGLVPWAPPFGVPVRHIMWTAREQRIPRATRGRGEGVSPPMQVQTCKRSGPLDRRQGLARGARAGIVRKRQT